VREHVLLPAARSAFDAAPPDDQRRFDEIFEALCADPSLAEPIKTLFDVLPDTIFRYDDGDYLVAYDLPDDATVRIWMIGRVPEPH
jgi:hypothetical protein